MKLPHLNHRSHGSSLLVTLALIMVVSIALTAVLKLSMQEYRMLTQSADWNAALPAAEAGVEEAMSHLRQVDGGSRAANGWVLDGGNYRLERSLGNGRFEVSISGGSPPVIIAKGYVPSVATGNEIVRRIRVTTKGEGLFTKGLAANEKISFTGQFSSDSFDSTDSNYSTDGHYDETKRKDRGDVATNAKGADAITLSGQSKIYGSIATGPTGGIQHSGNAAVGTTNYINEGGTDIQEGHQTTDMNVAFEKVTEPEHDAEQLPLPGVVTGVTYKYILTGGFYRLSTLSLSSSDKLLVLGDATLLVDKNVSLSGTAAIQIGSGASLQLYVKEGSISMSGQAVANAGGNAADFGIWGMPDMTTINLSGNGTIVCTINAPQASLKMSGSGKDILDFIGAAIVKDISGSGHFRFHYDEALGKSSKNLVIYSWNEI